MEKQRVAIYNRISPGKDLAEEIMQENKIVGAYLENNDIELVGIYRDVNCHTVEERPAYNQVIKDIFEGKVDTLVVTNISRLTRNQEIEQKIFDTVEVIQIGENGKEINSFSDIYYDMQAFFNEKYLKDLGKKTRQCLELKKNQKTK